MAVYNILINEQRSSPRSTHEDNMNATAKKSPVVTTITKTDTAASTAVQKAAAKAPEGVLHGLVPAEQMEVLYKWSRDLDALIAKHTGTTVEQQPRVTLSVGVNDRRQLGHYKLGRDGLGLAWRIEMNAVHLGRGAADVAATLCHEKLHGLQHALARGGKPPYHDVEFQTWSEKLGIPTDSHGHDKGIAWGSPFHQWCKEHGLKVIKSKPSKEQKDINPTPVKGDKPFVPPVSLPKPKGSSHVGWACGCTNVRVAKGLLMKATCAACGEDFVEGKVAPRAKGIKRPE